MDKEKLKEYNDQLKDYINESKFVSNKCRNKVIKMLADSFGVNIPKDDYYEYANVDVSIQEDGKLKIRNREYISNSELSIDEKFNNFKDKADVFLSKKEITFENMNTFDNILNLVIVLGLGVLIIVVSLIAIRAILLGDLSFAIWFIVFIIPRVIPNLKERLDARVAQARVYLKRLIKRIKKNK